MKIGCPNCGQHYDVEAGALDRFYRCTECGEIFQGINAKPVKAKRYRRKSKNAGASSAAASSASARPAAETATVPVLGQEPEAAPAQAPANAESGANAGPGGDAAVNLPDDSDRMEGRQIPLFPTLILLLLLIAFVFLCCQNARICRLDTANRKLAGQVERLTSELDALKTATGK